MNSETLKDSAPEGAVAEGHPAVAVEDPDLEVDQFGCNEVVDTTETSSENEHDVVDASEYYPLPGHDRVA